MPLKFPWRSFIPQADLGWNRVRTACASQGCHRKLLMRTVPQSVPGVHVGNLWYCSPDCFSAGAQAALVALTLSEVAEMPRTPRLSLGLALLSKGFLTEAELRSATDRSQWRGESLESTLLHTGLVSEKQIAAARAVQWGYPALAQEAVAHAVPVDLPKPLLESCSAVPLHYAARPKRLVLGFVDRVDHNLLQSIEQITDCRPEPCFITRGECEEQTRHMTAVPDYKAIVLEEPESLARVSRRLGGAALEVDAREARFTRCRSWAWIRVSGQRGNIDVLFPAKIGRKSFASADERESSTGLAGSAAILG